MKTYSFIAFLLCIISVYAQRNDRGFNFGNTPLPNNLQGIASWDLLTGFSDDFEHNDKNSAQFRNVWDERYNPDPGFQGPGQTRWFIRNTPSDFDAGLVTVNNGNLIIRTAAGQNGTVNCGIISSKNTVRYPIYMEARIRVSNLRTSSNFWSLNECDNEEIDMLECYGGDPDNFYAKQMSTNFHIWHRQGVQNIPGTDDLDNCGGLDITDFTYQTFFTTNPNSADFNSSATQFWRNDFHNFGVYWASPTSCTFYIDGQPRFNGSHYVDQREAFGLTGSFEDGIFQCPNADVLRCATERPLSEVQGQSAGGSRYPNRALNDGTFIILDQESHNGRPVDPANVLNNQSRNGMVVQWVRTYRPNFNGRGNTGGNTGGDTGGNTGGSNGGSNNGTNLAAGRPAFQSSTYLNNNNSFGANRVVDNSNTSFNHTNSQNGAWWEVDLGSSQNISSVRVFNRADCCGNRLSNFDIKIYNSRGGNLLRTVSVNGSPSANGTSYDVNATGRVVRIQLRGTNFLHIGNVEVFGGGTSTGGNTGGNNAGQIIANGLYRITNPRLNQSLLARALENHDARVVDTGNFADQQWRFEHLGNNVYTIKNNGTGRYLEVESAQCFNGANVKTWTNSDGDHKKWSVERNGSNFTLKPTHCLSRAMDVAGGARNGEVHLWAANPNNANQVWSIVRLGNKSLNSATNEIKVYPTVLSSGENLTIEGLTKGNNIYIFNSLGQRVKELFADENSTSLETSNLNSGVYFIQIDTNTTFKFIVK